MPPKRIFMTGASGCIGHYIAETLIQETDHELFFLVRNLDKFQVDYTARPNVTVLQGDLREIERFGDLLKTVNIAILTATAWGGTRDAFDINVVKTIRLMNLLDLEVCEQVIYFSTASILNRDHSPLKQAGQLGTDYIRSKYECHGQLSKLAIASKIIVLFPTLVFGGEEKKPYSHLSSGLGNLKKWLNLIRFFKADGSFHFIHAKDIAKTVHHLIDHSPINHLNDYLMVKSPDQFVLGNQPLKVDEAIREMCRYFGKRVYLRIPLSIWLANFFIKVFQVKMAPWDRFCLNEYRHQTYQDVVNPSTFGLPSYCSTVSELLKVSGIAGKKNSKLE